MKLGAEPRKVAMLAGLLAVAGYLFYSNSASDAGGPSLLRRSSQQSPEARPATGTVRRPASTAARAPSPLGGIQEFRPSLKPRRPEERPDPMSMDPTLRLDLLAKLREVQVDGARRSLFEFSSPPPPKVPEPKIIPKLEADSAGPAGLAAEKPAANKPKPPPPPITLKFYGYISPARSAGKRAFFLDGEDIFVAGEGDVIRKRYKVIRIGVNSAVVEDTEHDHKQTLALVEQAG